MNQSVMETKAQKKVQRRMRTGDGERPVIFFREIVCMNYRLPVSEQLPETHPKRCDLVSFPNETGIDPSCDTFKMSSFSLTI